MPRTPGGRNLDPKRRSVMISKVPWTSGELFCVLDAVLTYNSHDYSVMSTVWPLYQQAWKATWTALYSLLTGLISPMKSLLPILGNKEPCFTVFHFTDIAFFKINGRFVATLRQASLLAPFSNKSCSLCVSMSRKGNSCSISTFFMIIPVMVICDQRSLMWLLQRDYGLMKVQMIVFFSNKVFSD